jgi:hypothetical protein
MVNEIIRAFRKAAGSSRLLSHFQTARAAFPIRDPETSSPEFSSFSII